MTRFCSIMLMLGIAATLATCAALAVDPAEYPSPPAVQADSGMDANVQVLTRGPIHEAFAQPVETAAVEPLVIPKQPPEPIDETPPDMRPADERAMWISGYWAWDDDRNNFEWVCGVWRVPPPGRQWVAGYWATVPGGYSWASGFWAPAQEEQLTYYPQPPATGEAGPTGPAPSPDDIWISGQWRWRNASFAWEPGSWRRARADMIWTPASYTWSPRGWIFVSGYWDYLLSRRGVLFDPVYFTNDVYRRPGFVFSPSVALDPALLTAFMFVRPDYCHYYFGDYYAESNDRLGIYPWYAAGSYRQYKYDPLFAYYSWANRTRDPDWAKNLRGWHAYYRAHPEQRPAHDLAAMRRALTATGNRPDRQLLHFADTLQHWRGQASAPFRLETFSAERRNLARAEAQRMGQFRGERLRMESQGLGARPPAGLATKGPRTPETLRLPKLAGTTPGRATGRMQGTLRESLKPITPETPERKETPGEMRRPITPRESPRTPEQTPGEMRRPTTPSQLPRTPERTPGEIRRPITPQQSPARTPETRENTPPRPSRESSGPPARQPHPGPTPGARTPNATEHAPPAPTQSHGAEKERPGGR